MTFIEKYDYLKEKYVSNIDISKLTDSFIAAQITFTDDDCAGTLYTAYINGILSFEPYDYHDNTVSIIVSSKLLERLIEGKTKLEKEYLSENIQVYGNLDHALQIIQALGGHKQETVKKRKASNISKTTSRKKTVKPKQSKKTVEKKI